MNNQNQSVLDDSRIGRLLLKLSLPAFLGMFVMTLYNVVDTIFIGHYIGPLGIAGLTIVFPLQMMAIGIGELSGMGGASVVSRLIGSGKIPRAERAVGNAVTATVLMSAIIMTAGLSNPDFWLKLLGASDTVLPYARDYMTIILVGMFFMSFAMALNNLIRSEGNARIPMVGMIIGAVLNIILDAVFIIALDMGIKGAALATVISQIVSVTYFLRYYFAGKSFLKIRVKNLVIEWDILKPILAIGVASFARMLAGSLSAIFVNRALVAYGGDYAISAFGILHRILMFAIMPGITIGSGLQPILGFNYGAKRYDKALQAIKLAIIAATACSIIVFLAIYFIPEPFVRIFTTDSELITMASHAAKRLFLVMPMIGFMFVGSLVFQSIGKAKQSFITAIARPVLFLVPSILILPRFLQLDGVWWSFPIADAFTIMLTLSLLIPQIKDLRRMNSLQKAGILKQPAEQS
jgi:putative MATE family efflux protein